MNNLKLYYRKNYQLIKFISLLIIVSTLNTFQGYLIANYGFNKCFIAIESLTFGLTLILLYNIFCKFSEPECTTHTNSIKKEE